MPFKIIFFPILMIFSSVVLSVMFLLSLLLLSSLLLPMFLLNWRPGPALTDLLASLMLLHRCF
jgi:hypothetical protein